MNRRAFLALLPALPAAAVAIARAKPPLPRWNLTPDGSYALAPLVFSEYADPDHWEDKFQRVGFFTTKGTYVPSWQEPE